VLPGPAGSLVGEPTVVTGPCRPSSAVQAACSDSGVTRRARSGPVMTSSALVAVVTLLVIMLVVVWFDVRCLVDLARTCDRRLRYFTRNAWALIIVVSFPIGPVLYLMYAKGPSRPR
jgi:hypothetical protein